MAKRIDLDAIKEAIEERDDAVRQYHDLAQNMVYHGNSVSHWYCKATAYGDALSKVWSELQAAGVTPDGNKTCADGVRELADRKAPSNQPEPVAPTRGEAVAVYTEVMAAHGCETLGDMAEHFAHAVLARWGTPANNIRGTH